jgi:uncharacterized protein YbgA (DUF1722 family)/uncharacterized protein YbbK (DUF523 family)
MSSTPPKHRPRVAISACLMGSEVRYDGGHKRDRYCTEVLAGELEMIPVCPEAEAGLGIPRPPIHLRRSGAGLRLTQVRDVRTDVTQAVTEVAERRAVELGDISGFILKRKSPSCGMERVPIYTAEGKPRDYSGMGVFARRFAELRPLVPLEEEGRLNDPLLRENFLERVYALHRWYRLDPGDVSGFIDFHASHKLMLMARGSSYYTRLGRIVAGVTRRDLAARRERYIHELMPILKRVASRKRHVNALQHALGFLKRDLDSEDKRELLRLFEDYRRRRVPLAAPLALLRHHLRRHPSDFLHRQHYLQPYPDSLALRADI